MRKKKKKKKKKKTDNLRLYTEWKTTAFVQWRTRDHKGKRGETLWEDGNPQIKTEPPNSAYSI